MNGSTVLALQYHRVKIANEVDQVNEGKSKQVPLSPNHKRKCKNKYQRCGMTKFRLTCLVIELLYARFGAVKKPFAVFCLPPKA